MVSVPVVLLQWLFAGLLVSVLSSTSVNAQCNGQFAAGQICGNANSSQGTPNAQLLSPLIDRNFGAPSARGMILNRGASLWTATLSPVLGNPGFSTGALGLASSSGGTATVNPPAVAGATAIQLPSTSGTVPTTAAAPLILNATTGALTCPSCLTGPGGAITANSTATSGFTAGQFVYSDGAVVQAASVTGTLGNVVLSVSPEITGHPTIEGVTSTGATGTGNFVFSISPALTGVPTAPTPLTADSSTTIATTAYVQANLGTTGAFLRVANNLSDLNNTTTARSNLGVAIGSNVQAWSATLDALAAGTYAVGGVLSGTLPNPGMAAGAASTNIGSLGGVLSGTLPNPGMAAGAASTNIGSLGGDLTGTLPNPTLAAIGSATGPIGSATVAPIITIDAKGRVTALTSAAITSTPSPAPCGWRQNMASSPNNTAPTTLKWLIGPAFFIPCTSTSWNQITSPAGGSVWKAVDSVFVSNVGQGGRGSLQQSTISILNYSGQGCSSPCVSTPGTYATVTFTNASPTVVTWTAHGLTTTRSVTFCDGNDDFYGPDCRYPSPGTIPTGIDKSAIYYVCGLGITTDTFSLSTTRNNAISNICDVNTSSTGSGTLKGNNGTMGGLDPGDATGSTPLASTTYNIYLVARNDGAGAADWGLVYGTGGCTAAGPSATVQVTFGFNYWMCFDWIRSNGATPPTGLAYMTMKNNWYWTFAGGSGTGGAGTATLPQIATGVQAQWTGIDLSAFGFDGNTGRFNVAAVVSTDAEFARVAGNVHFGNYIPCGAVGVSGTGMSVNCDVVVDEGLIAAWSNSASTFYYLVGGEGGF